MGERRIVGPGKTRGYTYPARKKRLVGSGIKPSLQGYKYLSWVYGVDRKICHKGH